MITVVASNRKSLVKFGRFFVSGKTLNKIPKIYKLTKQLVKHNKLLAEYQGLTALQN